MRSCVAARLQPSLKEGGSLFLTGGERGKGAEGSGKTHFAELRWGGVLKNLRG